MKNLILVTIASCTAFISCNLYAKEFQYDVSVINELSTQVSLQYAKREMAVVAPKSTMPAVNFKDDGTNLAVLIQGEEYCKASTGLPFLLDLGKTHFIFRLVWQTKPSPRVACYLYSEDYGYR